MLSVNSILRSQEYAMHKYPDIFESATFSCRFGFRLHVSGESGIRIRNFFNPLSLANGTFLRRYESGIMWKLIRIILLSDDVTRWSPVLNREYSSTKLSFLYFLDFFFALQRNNEDFHTYSIHESQGSMRCFSST